MAEIWFWFINDLAVISSATWKTWNWDKYWKLYFNRFIKGQRCRKKKGNFFSLRVILYRFNKSWPKIKTFHARERPCFQDNFYLQIKNPPTSENTTVDNLFRWLSYGKKVEVKRRPRSFAPVRFSLTTTLKSLDT